MKRLLLVALLWAGCSKTPTPGEQVRVSIQQFKSTFVEYQALARRHSQLDKGPSSPDAEREIESLRQSASQKGERLKSILESMAPLADRGLQAAPNDLDCLEAQWMTAYLHEEHEKADPILDRMLKLKPDEPRLAARQAANLRKQGKYAEARKFLAPVLERRSDDPNVLMEDGAAASALDEFETAEARLGAAQAHRDRLELPFLLEFDDLLGETKDQLKQWTAEKAIRAAEAKAGDLPRVRLETSKGAIVVELFENEAPNTVANFIDLADRQFYDGTKFHRVLADFMAQGGDPLSKNESEEDDGSGGPGYAIADELPEGKYRHHFRGSLSMANSGPDTAGSQFFITHRPTTHLDGRHTVFGRVVDGMDVACALAKGDTLVHAVVLRKRDHPYRPVVKD